MNGKRGISRLLAIAMVAAMLMAMAPAASPALAVSTNIVISQVYGGGGNNGGVFTNDFVELFNRGTLPQSLAGWSIQYASASGTGNFGSSPTQITELPAVTLQPGQYLLVQEAAGSNVIAPLPTPDVTDSSAINMSGTGGKVALVNSVTGLGCNGGSTPCTPAQLAQIVDMVGWDGANFYEGAAAAPATTNPTAVIRNNGGCTDTDNNAADFAVGTPAPRNTATTAHYCTGPTNPTGVGAATPAAVFAGGSSLLTVAVTPGNFPPSTALAVAANLTTIGGIASQTLYDDGTNGDVTAGDNTFSFAATVPAATATGAKSLPVSITDAQARSGSTSISLLVRPALVAIHDIQGASHTSPKLGVLVSTQGIVTAKTNKGFYLQDGSPDSDPATSEGILVFLNSLPSVSVGDLVLASGTVAEFRPSGSSSTNLTITELGGAGLSVTVLSSGNALPAPIVIGSGGRVPPSTVIEDDATGSVETSGVFDPANDGIDFYESLEGMRVQLNDARVVGPYASFGSNREIYVVGDDGANAGVLTARGGVQAQAADYNPERIVLNDAGMIGLPPLPTANVGDRFPGATVGIIDYSFGNYKLLVTSLAGKAAGGLARETAATAPLASQLRVGTFNVENLSPNDPQSKFDTLAGLIVNNLRAPDLLAIEEIQDNSGATDDGTVVADVTYAKLIAAISTAGGPAYSYRQIDPVNNEDGGQTGGNIRVAFLYRTDTGLSFVDRPGGNATTATSVTGSGATTALSLSPGRVDPANPAFVESRKPLAGEFVFHGDKVFVVANHWNSKSGDQPLFGRFQPPAFVSEIQRLLQAQVVRGFVESLVAADAGTNVVVLGDLNDFYFSQPVHTLKDGLMVDLIESLPVGERYTYDYQGNSEDLDHILAVNATAARTYLYDAVHVNSEFADQASDHDPQVAYLCVDRTGPVFTLTPSETVLWPANHKYTTVTVSVSASDNSGMAQNWSLVSVVSNEPDDGLGDGDTPNDIVKVNDTTFKLRAERAGLGDGRSYTITYTATDACGNTTTSTAVVTVPRDLGK